jgi:hypothetical protein
MRLINKKGSDGKGMKVLAKCGSESIKMCVTLTSRTVDSMKT